MLALPRLVGGAALYLHLYSWHRKMSMHFYSRTQPGAARPGNLPSGILTPDGQLHLGMPIAPSAQRSDPLATLAADASAGSGIIVLMNPPDQVAAADADVDLRAPLAAALIGDMAVLGVLLSEVQHVVVQRQYMLVLVLSALVVDVVGLWSCRARHPSQMELLVVAAIVQFFVSALPRSQSIWLLLHCGLQPVLASCALELRRTRVPLWFSTGRRWGGG